jgi:hypothetical protein
MTHEEELSKRTDDFLNTALRLAERELEMGVLMERLIEMRAKQQRASCALAALGTRLLQLSAED